MQNESPADDKLVELITQPHFERQPDGPQPSADPISTTMMVVDIEQITPYDRNPRQVPNSLFERIKESIRIDGLDQFFSITRRPGDEHYMVAAGGNTRYRALYALWKETGDERFHKIQCIFRPWSCDTKVLVAHLRENDHREELTFIDRALAMRDLRQMIEDENGEKCSIRQLADSLSKRGYKISKTLVGWYDYAVDVLNLAIPTALQSGMGRPQIERIRKIEGAFHSTWEALDLGEADAVQDLFIEVLSRSDGELLDLDLLHRDLEEELSVSADCDIQRVALLFGSSLDGQDLRELLTAHNSRDHEPQTVEPDDSSIVDTDDEPSEKPDDAVTPTSEHSETTPNPDTQPGTKPAADELATPPPEIADAHSDASRPPLTPEFLQAIGVKGLMSELPTDLKSLRSRTWTLASHMAALLRMGPVIVPIKSGYGFLVGPVAPELLVYLQDRRRERRELANHWWALATLSEQFASHGKAAAHSQPQWADRPIGEAMRAAQDDGFVAWQQAHFNPEAINEVPFLPLSDLGEYGFNACGDRTWELWVDLATTTRVIRQKTEGDPWT